MTTTANTDIDGMNVRWLTTGSGTDVVLLHGWGCDLSIWKGVQEHLEQDFRVTSLDFPGFGESGEPSAAWGMDEYAAWFDLFLKEAGIVNPILIGHSFGGRVSLLWGSRNPVRKMVLVDAAGVKPRRSAKYYVKIYSFKTVKRVAPILLGRKKADEIIKRKREKTGSADYNAASEVMRSTLTRVVNHDLRYVMPQISAPTLLVWGANDAATPVRDARIMEKLIKDSGLVVFEGAGHYSFLERPAQFAAILDSFLSDDRIKK